MNIFNTILLLFLSQTILFSQQTTRTLLFDGSEREYILYIPANYDNFDALPLLFNFHGGSGYAADYLNFESDMRSIADTAGCILVYPQALADPNDGGSTNWIHKDPTDHDDVYFVEALIDTLSYEFNIDNKRVYVCGYSLGGEFTYALMCRLNNKIAAGAAVARTMQNYHYNNCSPVHPTGMMSILGTDDSISPYDGLSWNGETYYVSADDMHSYWANFNNSNTDPIEEAVPNTNLNDGSTVDRRMWLNDDGCVYVMELRVNGGGHDWPGSNGNMDINSNSEIWNFVSSFDIDGKMECSTTFVQKHPFSKGESELLKSINLLGQKAKYLPNMPIIEIYHDGTFRKKVIVE